MSTDSAVMTAIPGVVLRELGRPGDAENFLSLVARNRTHLATLIRYGGAPYSSVRDLDAARRYLTATRANEGRHEFGVWKNDELVGMAGITVPVVGRAEVHYWIDFAHRGEGLATVAVGALVAFAFGRAGVDALAGVVRRENVASERVLERNRFARLHADEQFSFYCRMQGKGAAG